MTDNEIIKAKALIKKLEEAYEFYYDVSRSMPYDIDTTVRETAICLEKALDEINRQQADVERLKNLLAEEEAKHIETSKCFYKAGIKDFAHTFTECFIIILNLNYEQANVARRCEEELVKGMVGEG